MAEVRLDMVSKVFDGNVKAVNNVSATINDKEFVVLVGPSGCGKSTVLRMIAGLEEITEGTITIDGTVVNDLPPKDRDIAMVFQNYALYPHMTVYENLAFGLKLRKLPKAEIDARVRTAARTLAIEEYLDRKPKALSGGQRQRVALGRAIVRQPKVFLFDEPLSNLDANLRVQMRTEISRLHHQLQTTMIYVTHDQIEAMSMGDRIVVMRGGIVQQVDTPLRIYHHPVNRFVAGFIGSPTMNFLAGTLVKEARLSFRQKETGNLIPLEAEAAARLSQRAGSEVTFGIRPEHLHLAPPPGGESSPLRARIEVVEPVGNEIFLYFTTGDGASSVARITGEVTPAVGATVDLHVDIARVHYFDADTEATL